MTEGWNGDDYLILFDQQDITSASNRYAISQWLPGYEVIGLRGWDDFIVRDSAARTYSVPTIPALPQHLSAFALPAVGVELLPDSRFRNLVKWYVRPIAFGGDPNIHPSEPPPPPSRAASWMVFWSFPQSFGPPLKVTTIENRICKSRLS